MKYASLGTVSHGTLLTSDLLDAFADELEYHVQRNAEAWCSDAGRAARDAYLDRVNDAREMDPDDEFASEMVETLTDSLGNFAAPYTYFGAHEGDGSDFGYWPAMDAIDELPRVQDSDEAKAKGEDCCFVNDHGNVTVYNGLGEVIAEFV